jgi:hypothetical protein
MKENRRLIEEKNAAELKLTQNQQEGISDPQ